MFSIFCFIDCIFGFVDGICGFVDGFCGGRLGWVFVGICGRGAPFVRGWDLAENRRCQPTSPP